MGALLTVVIKGEKKPGMCRVIWDLFLLLRGVGVLQKEIIKLLIPHFERQ